MNPVSRLSRHTRLTWQSYAGATSPPFLTLYANSICNQKCEHCLYWRNLNRKDDLTMEEFVALSQSLGPIENLNLSGGEPFLRAEFSQICSQFIRQNGVRQIYVPTNAYFSDRIAKQVRETLQEPTLEILAIEMSLEGIGEFHDRFRGSPGSYDRALETYAVLEQIQREDPRLRIHAISTATAMNMREIRALSQELYERCPQMDHHNLSPIRGDRKNPSLLGPALEEYRDLYHFIRTLWHPRERGRYGSSVEPMLQDRKLKTLVAGAQVVPCRAGNLTGVVFSNGDVSVCETHAPIGNLREQSFPEIWNSPQAKALRESIARRQCWCTNEIAMWPSIVFQPLELLKAALSAKPWSEARPDTSPLPLAPPTPEGPVGQLISITTPGNTAATPRK